MDVSPTYSKKQLLDSRCHVGKIHWTGRVMTNGRIVVVVGCLVGDILVHSLILTGLVQVIHPPGPDKGGLCHAGCHCSTAPPEVPLTIELICQHRARCGVKYNLS